MRFSSSTMMFFHIYLINWKKNLKYYGLSIHKSHIDYRSIKQNKINTPQFVLNNAPIISNGDISAIYTRVVTKAIPMIEYN